MPASTGEAGLSLPDSTGIVIIGRNEGERLRRALERLGRQANRVVYVDSGSTDDSREHARAFEIPVVELDATRPFTAARSRNAGFDYLLERWPGLDFVQFLDGDCVLSPNWLHAAVSALSRDPELAVVTGMLREMHRDASVYNRLCDLEWDGPVGEIETCGGIAMMRAKAFREVGGMNPDLIAGEEADLHIRMRRAGYRLERIAEVMAYHDAALTEFRQWWLRNVRSGHACAEGAFLYGSAPERHNVKESRSNWLWGLVAPGAALALGTLGLGGGTLLVSAGYPMLYAKILRGELARGRSLADAELYARYTVLGKVPQALGQLRFHWDRARGRKAKLYEYKDMAVRSARREA